MLDTALLRALAHVGFDEKEARVYLAGLELGKGTATAIAKRAELKRPIVYHVLERLKKRGFAHEATAHGKILSYSVSDPADILQNVRASFEDLRMVLPILRAFHHKQSKTARVEYFEGKDAILSTFRMYERAKQTQFITSIERLNGIIPEEVRSWTMRYRNKAFKRKTFTIVPDVLADREWAKQAALAGIETRLLPKEMSIEMDFAIADDLVGITSFDPLFVVVIYSEAIARSAQQLFDLGWKYCRPFRRTEYVLNE